MNEASVIHSIALLRDVLFDVVHYGAAIDESYAKERLASVCELLLGAAQPQDKGSAGQQSASPCNTGSPKLPPCGMCSLQHVRDTYTIRKFRHCPWCGRQLNRLSSR